MAAGAAGMWPVMLAGGGCAREQPAEPGPALLLPWNTSLSLHAGPLQAQKHVKVRCCCVGRLALA